MKRTSLLQQLAGPCAQGPNLPALVDASGATLSRKQLSQRVRDIARGFSAAGLRCGDRVLFAVRPDARATVLMIAIAEAGGVLVPLDSTMGAALFASRMEMLSPQWVVAESVLLLASTNRWILRFLSWRGVRLLPIGGVQNAQFVRAGPAWPAARRSLSLAAIERQGATVGDSNRVDVDDAEAGFIVSTSGTTGAPKAVVHSWRSLQAIFDAVGSLLGGGSKVIYARDLHLILPALFEGSTVVIPRRSAFSAARLLQDLNKHAVTHLFAVTAECQQLLDHLRTQKLALPSSLREIWIGAAPVHAAFLRDFEAGLAGQTKIWCVYGTTEILPVARVSLPEKLQFEGEGDLVGECVPGVRADVSADGELLLSGPNLFTGYFGEPACAEHATGDLARLDNGRIVLLGRRKDMIIRGRFNIYPELYEPVIERIDGVRRCAMVGIYDAALADERVVLVVEPRAGIDAAELEQRLWPALRDGPFSIDAEALPDLILISALPEAGRAGKVDKQALREQAKREFA